MAASAPAPIADRSLFRQLLQPVAIAVAFVLLAVLLRSQWGALAALDWHLQPRYLVVSGACIVGGWLVEVALWRRLVTIVGGRLGYIRAVQLWFASAIVRYIPGNVWQPLNLAARCRAEGVRPEITIASLTLFHVIQILAVVLIAAVFMATSGVPIALATWTHTFSPWWTLPLAVPIVVFVLRPHALIVLANSLLGVVGRDPLPLDLTTTELATLLSISLAGWLLFSLGFTALALTFLPAGDVLGDRLPHVMAAYPLAFAIGFVSLITPSGLAVREGMIFVLLSPIVGGAHAVVLALGMRVWEIVLDGITATAAMLSLARRSPR